MSTQTTFKTVFRPITKVVSTILPGQALDFSGRTTTLRFTANQPLAFTSFVNEEHFFDGMPVIIHNQGTSSLIIDASLMANNANYDIEADTTGVFTYLAANGKLFDNGGSAYAKDIQENLDEHIVIFNELATDYSVHEHNGSDGTKIKVSNLDRQGIGAEDWVLALNSSNVPVFKNLNTYNHSLARWSNTDIATNITPSGSWTEVPIMGTQERRDDVNKFASAGNGIQITFTGRVRVKAHIIATSAVQNTQLDIAIKKNTAVQPRIASSFARSISGANEATCFISDEFDVLPGDIITVVARQGGSNGSMTMLAANSCYLEVEIPVGVFAKGDKGDPGYAGWQYIAQPGVPSYLLGNDGDVYMDTDNGNFYQKAAGVWSLRTNLLGPKGSEGVSKTTIWAERTGNLTNNSEEWSFGADSISGPGRGVTQTLAGKITHIGLECQTPGTTSVSVEVMINGVASGRSITLSPSVYKDITVLGSPILFGASDVIGFRTVLGGGAANARVTALIAYNGIVNAPIGYVIPEIWKYKKTLTTTDITNGYIDLPHLAIENSVNGTVGRLSIFQNEDFNVSDSSGISRITFTNALASGGAEELEVNDTLYFNYQIRTNYVNNPNSVINLDGGTPSSVYGGVVSLDGGGP